MNCSSAEAFFERFLDGKLAPVARQSFNRHVDSCVACQSMLEEMRAVDALLHAPRQVELAPNFTFAMMAQARALPVPAPARSALRAYLVSYLVGAWLIAAALLFLAPQIAHAIAGTSIGIVRSIADAAGGLGAMISRLFGRGGNALGVLLGALIAFDLMLAVSFGVAVRFMRPRLVERLRS